MEPVLTHLLKSCGILLLFLLSYTLFLKKETFFSSNRWFLLVGLVISFLLPFIEITKVTLVNRAPMLQENLTDYIAVSTASQINRSFDWATLTFALYLIGLCYFGFRLVHQLLCIKRLKKNSQIVEEGDFYHVKMDSAIAPFSFFKYIFYSPKQFDPNELKTIIVHEKVHARELHSIDILLMEVILIAQWFNPILWLYKATIKQNLEFLADSKTYQTCENKKSYQYLLLNQTIASNSIKIANPFYNSLIKKRIVMLNQNQSKKINLLKLFLILPLLGLFLVAFNTKEVVKFSEDHKEISKVIVDRPEFMSPLEHSDIEKITSTYGPAKDPFSKETRFHTGIDLKANSGTRVRGSAEGQVTTASYDNLKGNHVIIKHSNGYITKYMHLKNGTVDVGDKTAAGETIGYVGNTGRSTGPHLHFEIRKSGKTIDPESVIAFKGTGKKAAIKTTLVRKQPQVSKATKSIELLIDKDTSDEELENMKKDLAERGVDFSYTVVHNDKKEIIDITLQLSGESSDGKKFSGNYNSSSDEHISPIAMLYDDEASMVSFGNPTHKTINIHSDDTANSIIHVLNSKKHKSIRITEENGVKKILVDGKEVDKEELKEMNINVYHDIHEDSDVKIHVISDEHDTKTGRKHIKIKENRHGKGNDVIILGDSDDDSDIEILGNNNLLFINDDEKKQPLFYVDGKKSSREEIEKLSQDDIEKIEVSKGKGATKKYGKKAKNGVVEITTKKKE